MTDSALGEVLLAATPGDPGGRSHPDQTDEKRGEKNDPGYAPVARDLDQH